MKKIGEVDVEFGNVALLKKEYKDIWEKEFTGEFLGIKFWGGGEVEVYKKALGLKWDIEETFGRYGQSNYFIPVKSEDEFHKKVSIIESWKEEFRFAFSVIRDNTYDRFFKDEGPIIQINSKIPSTAYVANISDGLYDVYQTEEKVEIRLIGGPYKEEIEEGLIITPDLFFDEVCTRKKLDEITLNEKTAFIFEDLGYINRDIIGYGIEFELVPGSYVIEQAFDIDDEITRMTIKSVSK